jgi:hypothetical protein
MNDKFQTPKTEPEKPVEETTPVREPDFELTPKAKATAANKLPRSEQLEKFEQHLEVHDPGNQPA